MGVFIKRPLCLFCFCFIGASLSACALGLVGKIIALAVFAAASALLFYLSFRIRERKYGLIEAAICTVFASTALLSSIFAIELPLLRLEKFTGESAAVEFVVCEEEYSSKYSTKYNGILLSTDKGKIDEKAYLVLDHEADHGAGDRLLLLGDVTLVESKGKIIRLPSDVNLTVTSTLDKELIVCNEYDGRSISVICARLGEYVRGIFTERLEPEAAALSLGILTGNSSMISGEVVRDFRRTGLSHLLAVSGLHLTVLLGAFEFLLTKLRISKLARCVIITALSFGLLSLAAFSVSACRSVLMLLCTYLCYALSREPDTLTSLSVAGALILFISPASVGSISFWLSFLATLGIVLYSEATAGRRIVRLSAKGIVHRTALSIVKKILGALTVTVSANVFICIVLWLLFGETSVVSPISNLFITPLANVYLVITLCVFIFGYLPLFGALLASAASFLSALITEAVSYLSSLEYSVVSLKYAFAGVIITLGTVALAVMFIVKLRKRIWLFITPLFAVAAFCVCLTVHNALDNSTRIAYINEGERDALVVAKNGECVIIDVSDGSYSSIYNSYEWASDAAFVEIESVVLTHYHTKHISSIDKILRHAMIRQVLIPAPESEDELLIMKDIAASAIDNGVSLKIFGREERLFAGEDISLFVLDEAVREGSSKKIISFAVATSDGMVSYADLSWQSSDKAEAISHFVSLSDALVLGSHGPIPTETGEVKVAYPNTVVFANAEALALSPAIPFDKTNILIARESNEIKIREFKLLFD